MKKVNLMLCIGLCSMNLFGQKIELTSNKAALIFSRAKTAESRPDTLVLSTFASIKIKGIKVTGENAAWFKTTTLIPKQVTPQKNEKVAVAFDPPADFAGIAKAVLQIQGPNLIIPLTGLGTKGIEGENEAPLSLIVNALGYSTNVGWTTLPNHLRPELQGEELAPSLFQKAGTGPVEILPVARYSPDFPLHFGYYFDSPDGPRQRQVGVLAKAGKYPEHQTLFPTLVSGNSSFDPGTQPFGFYAISPDHTFYSEDCWNILLYPSRAAHAVRVYPVKEQTGKTLENSFIVCMEEAANGDYNDYVFLVKNIKPVPIDFPALMNGKNFDGWYKWLQGQGRNNDPDNNFTIEEGGIFHDTGKVLGYVMTEKGYRNFHLKLDFKWGEKKWPPRENAKRDSGICYNIPDNEADNIWPASIECQVQEGDVGDFWLLGFSTVQVDGKQNVPLNHSRIMKKKDAEKPTGEWNTVEVISFNGKCVHIVNGVVVNYGENSSLVGGRILLQSEYAEIYYRNVRLKEL